MARVPRDVTVHVARPLRSHASPGAILATELRKDMVMLMDKDEGEKGAEWDIVVVYLCCK